MKIIQYSKRPLLLQRHQPPIKIKTIPVFKCLPPLRYQHLTDIIFENFHHIQKYIKRPLVIKLGYPTLQKQLVRAQYTPTD